jgi:hypothetical protein
MSIYPRHNKCLWCKKPLRALAGDHIHYHSPDFCDSICELRYMENQDDVK